MSRITLIKDKKIISQHIKILKTFKNDFTCTLITNMTTNQEYERFDSEEGDPILKIIEKYQNKPSIKLIKSKKKINLKLLDLEKLILMRSLSVFKIFIPKRNLKKVI